MVWIKAAVSHLWNEDFSLKTNSVKHSVGCECIDAPTFSLLPNNRNLKEIWGRSVFFCLHNRITSCNNKPLQSLGDKQDLLSTPQASSGQMGAACAEQLFKPETPSWTKFKTLKINVIYAKDSNYDHICITVSHCVSVCCEEGSIRWLSWLVYGVHLVKLGKNMATHYFPVATRQKWVSMRW